MTGPAIAWIDEIGAVLDALANREGFALTGMAGGVLYGFHEGDDTLYVAHRDRRDFHPCEPDEWEARVDVIPRPRPPNWAAS